MSSPSVPTQFDLFEDVLDCYRDAQTLRNEDLYRSLAGRRGLDESAFAAKVAIGRAGQMHSPAKRRVRWYQQSLKALGLLEGAGRRGSWRLTRQGREKLTPAAPGRVLLGFSTDLGVALWAHCESVFTSLDTPIDLVLSSLPYPLAVPRDYGNPSETSYVDWVCGILEPIVQQLAPGGSIVLNVGNDVFMKGSPARSMYVERMVLALHDRFELSLMDRLIWVNPARPPGPLRWSSLTRQQLNASYEPLIWMTNDPVRVRSNNRRVLQPHTEQQMRLMATGGERRSTSYGDGAHRVREGSYGSVTPGRIPRNVITMPHNCPDKRELARLARASGLPVHGATMPLKLAQLIIEFLTDKGDLVIDPCGGWMRTAKAAEITGRRWLSTEQMGEYVLGAALGFKDRPGFQAFGSA